MDSAVRKLEMNKIIAMKCIFSLNINLSINKISKMKNFRVFSTNDLKVLPV